MQFVEVITAFQNRIISGKIHNDFNFKDPKRFLKSCRLSFKNEITNALRLHKLIKVQTQFSVNYIIKKQDEEIERTMCFNSKMKPLSLFQVDEINAFYKEHVIEYMMGRLQFFEEGESGASLSGINFLQININKYDPSNGGQYIELPPKIAAKKAIINVQNTDDYCFAYSIMCYLNPGKYNKERVSWYKNFREHLDFDGIEFPVKINQIKRFEQQNNISVNVYTLNEKETKVVGPIYHTSKKLKQHVNLMYLTNDDNMSHYCFITDLMKLMGSQLNKSNQKKFFCDRCLNYTQNKVKFAQHEKDCELISKKGVKISLPTFGNDILKFKDYAKQLKLPFIMVCDIETLCVKIDSGSNNPDRPYLEKKQMHVPYAIGFALKFIHDDHMEYFETYMGEDCVTRFLNKLYEISYLINCVYGDENNLDDIDENESKFPLFLTQEEQIKHEITDECFICKEGIDHYDIKVRDHDHFLDPQKNFEKTGIYSNFRGTAHQSCNLAYKDPKSLTCYFHNGTNFDFHFIITAIAKMDPDIPIKALAVGTEKYLSFEIVIDDVKIKFVDSCKLLNASLDTLVSITNPNDLKFTRMHFGDNFDLMRKKGVLCYNYISEFDKLTETELPPIEAFYNDLTESHISLEDYTRAQSVWESFNCQNLGDYVTKYLESDITLMLDLIELFRDFCLETYGLDPAHFVSIPGLAYFSMLKLCNIEIELLKDADMLLFFEKALRGGICFANKKYMAANNKYMKNYDPEKPEKYLALLDFCSLYGFCLSQPLPVGEFEFLSKAQIKDFEVDTCSPRNYYGYLLEVDMVIPSLLHDHFKDLPPGPDHWIPLNCGNSYRLMATLYDKNRYVVHSQTLRIYQRLGVIVKKIHRILRFRQSNFMAKYVNLNVQKRAAATNSFHKNLFKLFLNAVYGRTLLNLRKQRDIKILRQWDGRYGARRYLSRGEFKKVTIFDENLIAVELKKTYINYNKPLFLGVTVLELSKKHFYDIYYNKIKPYFEPDITLGYCDTDSYFLETGKDIYGFIKLNPLLFDTSNYEKDNKFGIVALPQNKKKPGVLADELGGKTLSEFVCLKSKMYSYKVDGEDSEVKKAKGLTKQITKKITFDDYKKCLFEGDEYKHVYKKQKTLRSENHQVYTYQENKVTLDSKDPKRFINPNNKFETFPYGHYKVVNWETRGINEF